MKITIDTKMIEKAGLTCATIYGYFAENCDSTIARAARHLKMERLTVRNNLMNLENAGYLKIVRLHPEIEHSWVIGAEVLK